MENNTLTKTSYRMPGEWEQQWGVMLTWPHEQTDWACYLDDITETYLQMADAITRHEHLLVVEPVHGYAERLLQTRLSPTQQQRVVYHTFESDDTWARDHGPITLVGNDGALRSLDFHFNGWGKKFPAEKDNAINRSLYEAGLLHGDYESHLDFVLEGGSIESDGRGTVFTTSTCLLAPHRNQPLTRDKIEQQLKRRLHARRIVWLDHGELEGDDTDGHIDTIVRVAPDDTLLYVGAGDNDDPQHDDFTLLEQQLRALHTIEGKPYRLIALPMADAIYEDGERLPATYANFLVINGAVIYPTYAQPENDERAREAIAQAFPDREMIGIDARTIIRQHGSIHCLTMQINTHPDPPKGREH